MNNLKFTMNMRISQDVNMSFSSEGVFDDEEEARDAGEKFMQLAYAFNLGVANADIGG